VVYTKQSDGDKRRSMIQAVLARDDYLTVYLDQTSERLFVASPPCPRRERLGAVYVKPAFFFEIAAFDCV
jgi:hypothetical protein